MIQSNLPAQEIAEQVNTSLRQNHNLVVTAPPGAGKSTLLPLTILQEFRTEGRTLMLEPRRLAARQIAERMAETLNESVGQTVGYRIRREKKVSRSTQVEVITEGILTRMLISDPTLDGIAVVIFDEFHERNIHSDLALALIRESQQLVRPDLHLVIMSATIDTDSICKALNAPLIESRGRMFPITDVCPILCEINDDSASLMAKYVRIAHREHQGDILCFLPGEAEILRCMEMLGQSLAPTRIFPLYSMLSHQEQRLAIAPSREGERKVVLSTPIAETSLTIQGVRIVIDSGLCRKPVFDTSTGLTHLSTVRISHDMADQRRGRAGRVAAGIYYRLWSLASDHQMADNRTPEILEADLTPLLLDVAAWGETDPQRLPWLTPPPAGNLAQARNLLSLLGAVSADGRLTHHGRQLAQQPFHPRIANMLLTGGHPGIANLLADYLEGSLSANERRHAESVLLTSPTALRNDLATLIAAAYPERIAQALPEGCGQFRLASGEIAITDTDDELSGYKWIAVATLHARPGSCGRIFLAAPIDDIEQLSAFMTERDNLIWDNKRGLLIAQRETRIQRLLVRNKPLPNIPLAQQQQVIAEATKSYGTSMFDFNDDVLNLQRRISTVSQWHPELDLPDLSTENVLKRATEWVPLHIGKSSSTAELKRLDLCEVLWSLLTYEQQSSVNRIAPTHIVVPTGSRIRIEYRQGAELPILRVRLQECFGLLDTPRVDDGQHSVLMELLSPGFKPVQITSDLRSFWTGTYFEVRKELRRRYPKHSWPDNPLEAEAVRGVARKK